MLGQLILGTETLIAKNYSPFRVLNFEKNDDVCHFVWSVLENDEVLLLVRGFVEHSW